MAQSHAVDTIGSTPGFETIVDSGPGRFSSTLIDDRMAALIQDAQDQGCTAIEWAGTWRRGRTPRLLGATTDGGTVTGPSLTNGDVDGESFTASLATGGGLVGSTQGGNDLNGFFARIDRNRSIWYGVETDCGAPEPVNLVPNGDFQIDPTPGTPWPNQCVGACEWFPNTVPGWTSTGASGLFQPTTAYIAGVIDDEHVIYFNAGGAVSGPLGLLTTEPAYHVSFTLHTRFDAPPGTVLVDILADGSPIAPTATIGQAPTGSSVQVDLTVPVLSGTPGVSNATIRFALSGGTQGNVDDVFVTAGPL